MGGRTVLVGNAVRFCMEIRTKGVEGLMGGLSTVRYEQTKIVQNFHYGHGKISLWLRQGLTP